MLTRLEVNGFKNLQDFALDFGPYTCIAGPNGVGKSNIFDAIRFLSLLTDSTINEAALRLRNAGEDTAEIADLLFSGNGQRANRMRFAVEMIVDSHVRDDFGRETQASSSFLRYEVAFRYEPPSPTSGPLGGLSLEKEELRPITTGNAAQHLRFPHSKQRFRDSVVYNKRHARSGFISTETDPDTEQAAIVVHQDGGSHGRGRPSPAEGATRTIIGTENTSATPTILAAKREMQSWRILALAPAAMRRPDRYTQPPGIGADGAHIPATLQHLSSLRHQQLEPGAAPDDILGRVASRLADLIPVKSLRVVQDEVRQLYSLELEEPSGVRLRANSVSDGTLRFLALVAIAESSELTGVYCIEEPENGIHPEKLADMNRLLHDVAVDPIEAVADDNPLRQVVVSTHSPFFVQIQSAEDLVLAKNPAVRSQSGAKVLPLRCYPLHDTWRSRAFQRPDVTEAARQIRSVGNLELSAYVSLPEGTQPSFFPPEFWMAG